MIVPLPAKPSQDAADAAGTRREDFTASLHGILC